MDDQARPGPLARSERCLAARARGAASCGSARGCRGRCRRGGGDRRQGGGRGSGRGVRRRAAGHPAAPVTGGEEGGHGEARRIPTPPLTPETDRSHRGESSAVGPGRIVGPAIEPHAGIQDPARGERSALHGLDTDPVRRSRPSIAPPGGGSQAGRGSAIIVRGDPRGQVGAHRRAKGRCNVL
jgi:hypothetical protein